MSEIHDDNDKLMELVILPVTNRLLREGEPASLKIERTPPPKEEVVLCMTDDTDGSSTGHYLWQPGIPPETIEEARERFYSDLQDFISESSFGWGELRE